MMRTSLALVITLLGVACSSANRPDSLSTSAGGPGGGSTVTASSCSGRVCGADLSGASCGTCANAQTCSAQGLCEAAVPAGVTCPPAEPIGQTAGKAVKAGSFPLAHGGEYAIENSCAKPVYILGVTETCGICLSHLNKWTQEDGFFDRLKADGVDVILISTDNQDGENGSVKTAEALRKRFNLGDRFILGYEPLGRESFKGFVAERTRYAGARIALIVKPGNLIGAVGQVDDEATVRTALGLKP